MLEHLSISNYLELVIPIKGDSVRVQAISREVVTDPSETTCRPLTMR
jgi:hypothetical protein